MPLKCKKCDTCYLQEYKPKLYFHPKETIQPISWEEYIQKSTYIEKDRITFDCTAEMINQTKINNVPFYGKVEHKNYFTDITYIFIYPINPGYNICCQNIGYHTADIEHIIVRINNITNTIVKVYFSSHSKEHQIFEKKDLLFDEENHIKVFVSLCSHANYNKTKKYYRIMGLANDITKDNGVQWYAKKVIDINKMKDKQKFKSIGIKKNRKFCVTGLFNRKFSFDRYYYITNFKRFFLPCFI